MEKKKRTKICIALTVVWVLLFVLGLVLLLLDREKGISLWLFGCCTDEIMPFLKMTNRIVLSIPIIISAAAIYKYKKFSYIFSAVFFVAVFALIPFFGDIWRSYDYVYSEISSPDGNHEIVVCEWTWLVGSGGVFYEKTGAFFMKELGEFSTDDGYNPFSEGKYEVEWNDDGFDATYWFSYNGVEKSETVKY